MNQASALACSLLAAAPRALLCPVLVLHLLVTLCSHAEGRIDEAKASLIPQPYHTAILQRAIVLCNISPISVCSTHGPEFIYCPETEQQGCSALPAPFEALCIPCCLLAVPGLGNSSFSCLPERNAAFIFTCTASNKRQCFLQSQG